MPYKRVADLTPEELRYRRLKYRAYSEKRSALRATNPIRKRERLERQQQMARAKAESRTSREWRDAVKAKRRLESGFRHEISLHRLYERWQDWMTAERLLHLKGLAAMEAV